MNGHLTPEERHLTRDDLIDRLYGIAPAEVNTHFESCGECAKRLQALELRRTDSAAATMVSDEALAKQRRAILNRVEAPLSRVPSRIKWVPALAAACLLVVMALVYQPGEPVSTPATDSKIAKAAPDLLNDEQLFSEIYAIERAEEPRAATPIRQLFESGAALPQ
jgi:hypothetical protein